MKNVLKRSISMFLAVAIIFGSAYAGLEEIDFNKTRKFLKNIVPDFSVKSQAASEVNSGTCGDNLTWTLDDEGLLTISGTGEMNDYSSSASTVPWYSYRSKVKSVLIEKGVTNIGGSAFNKCLYLTLIVIPDTVTSIGKSAFEGCKSLTSIIIPESVTNICNSAFKSCISLESITIPKSVTGIKSSAFFDCTNLVSINVDENNANYSSVNGVLFNKGKTNLIRYPIGKTDTAYTIPNCVTRICADSFRYCLNLKTITIPDSVTDIGDFAFYNCQNLKSIRIPDSVTSIGKYVFIDCKSLTSVNLSENLTNLGNEAFCDCTSLETITIPDSVTKIGAEVFRGCTSLKSINVGENNLNYSSVSGVLFNKNKTSLIQYPVGKANTSYAIPDSVKNISDSAFYGCTSLKSITFPDVLAYIGDYAFHGCTGIKSIRIPDSVVNVGLAAFQNCSDLWRIDLNNPDIKWAEHAFHGTPVCDRIIENWTSEGFVINDILIETDTERYSKVLFNSLVQDYLEPVGDALETTDEKELAALTECVDNITAGLETDYEKIKAISKYICENVNYVYLLVGVVNPYDVLTKGQAACGGFATLTCDMLTIAGIPCHYVLGGAHAYNMAYDSDNQRWLYIDNTFARSTRKDTRFNEQFFDFSIGILGTLNHEVYSDFDFVIDSITYTLVLPTAPDKLWLNTDNWYWEVKDVPVETEEFNIPDNIKGISVTSIGDSAFKDCARLTSVTIPDSVTNIGEHAFNGCISLKSITIPDSVTNLGCKAFENTAYYNDSANWENDVLYIGDYLIKAKDTISGVYEIKVGTKRIAERSFYGCKNITSIVIADSITSIGDYAFYYCSGIDAITIPYSVTSIGEYAFWCCSKLATVTIPDSVTSIGVFAFGSCSGLTSVTIPNSVTLIGGYAFSNCTKLNSITIPNSVTRINGNVFSYCKNLVSVTIPDSVSSIGDYAFYGCANLEYVFYTGSENNWTNISIGGNNTYLTDASINYNFTGHNWGDWYVANEATCTSEGIQKRNCSTCTYYEIRPIAAVGHSYNSVVTEPICTQNGYTTHTCTNCGDVYKDSVVKAPGHTSGEWIIDELASCTKNGSKHIECTVCGKVLKTEVISATGHKQSNWIVDGESGCSTGGLKHIECTVCGEVLDTAIINPKGHRYSDWIIDKQPTCKTAGSKHKTCTGCGDVKTEAIKVISHDYSTEWIIDKEATCTENGSKSHHCLVCSDKADVTVITKLGHSFGDWIVTAKPTCTEVGSHSRTCSACGYVENEFVGIISHDYSTEWIIDKVASCTENGSKSHHCLVCGDKADVTVITALGHSYGDWVVDKEATCTEPGVKFKECTDCGEKLETEEIAEKGHSESSWIIDIEATVYKAGSKHKECTECGEILEAAEIPQLKCSKPKLKSISNTSSGVKITWGKVSGADKYRVYRKTSKTDWKYIGSTSKTSYTDKTAKSGTKYYYAVKARNEAGNSSLSSSLSKYYLADPTLKTPQSTKNGVSLKWTKTAGAQGYIIYRKTEEGSYKKLKTEKGVSNLSYVDKSAKKGKKYTYKVKAYYSKTNSAYSNAKTITDKY